MAALSSGEPCQFDSETNRRHPRDYERGIVMPLPGWDSLETVKTFNFSLHIAGLVFIALLALSEILAFVYGERRDTLIEASENAAALQRQTETNSTNSRHAAEVAGLRAKLDQTAKQVAEDHSVKARIRYLFASIDANILRELDGGRLELPIRMQPADIEQLQKLLAEPEGATLAKIESFGRGWMHSVIINGTLGPSSAVPQQIEVLVKALPALAGK
jgi:hypothetical protein